MMKTFSIIIPVYNGLMSLGRTLDSIYSQGMTNDSFEVICVDDCSPLMETFEMLNSYTYKGKHPCNLKVFRHKDNKRQGGARNTALDHAEGEWVLYLDQDDHFLQGTLPVLQSRIEEYNDCDICMFDYQLVTKHSLSEKRINSIYTNQSFKTEVISGADFIQKYPIPWAPWCYAYKKCFLVKHGMRFVENVRFPDTDYVMKATLLAQNMVFIPLDVYCHIHYDENTSSVGNDRFRIEELFGLTDRMRNVAESFMSVNERAAMAAMNHHIFRYSNLLKTILWRLPFSQIVELLNNYTPYEKSENQLVKYTRKYPRVYAVLAQVVRPFLLTAVWVRNKVKK